MDNVDLKVVDPANKTEPWDNNQGNWLQYQSRSRSVGLVANDMAGISPNTNIK